MLSVGAVCWLQFVYGQMFGEAGVASPRALLRLIAGTLVVLPLAWSALSLGFGLSRRLGLSPGTRTSVWATAGLVSLTFAVTVVPFVALRPVIHDWLDQIVPTSTDRSSSLPAEWFANESPLLCSTQLPPPSSAASGRELLLKQIRTNLRDAALAQMAVFPLCAVGFWAFVRRRSLRRRTLVFRVRRRALAPLFSAFPCAILISGCPSSRESETPVSLAVVDACSNGSPVRSYRVSAISVDMTLNRFGDHDPDAVMYVLDDRIPAVRDQEAASLPERVSSGLRQDAIQPLILRANLGECLVIEFTNRLTDGPASLSIHGLAHSVDNAAGAVGFNPNGFAPPGGSMSYHVPLPTNPEAERAYYFHSHGASRSRTSHGLFGAIVAEPRGSAHLDPETGEPLTGGSWDAIIDVPDGPDFREFVLMYHEVGDEGFEGILDADGRRLPLIDDVSGTYRPGSRAINYRSEPFRNRLALHFDKSQGYGSYMFGDPATPIPRSYLGEPTKTRLMHGGSELFHVHHLHGGGDRWRRNPNYDEQNDISSGLTKRPAQAVTSSHLDSQSIGPGTSYNLEHECGAGGCQQAAGDFLFHCHIGHHYISGMWAFWRVFDTLQPNLATLPDRLPLAAAVASTELVGLVVEGKRLVPEAELGDPRVEQSLEAFVEAQLPPPGVPLDAEDATVWDWQRVPAAAGSLYLGEPETGSTWANYTSPSPGERPVIGFNPGNGRPAWPLFRPHLGQRPPFSPNGHTGAPWLGETGGTLRPDGLCPNTAVVPELVNQKMRQYPVTAISVPIPVTSDGIDNSGKLFVLGDEKDEIYAGTRPRLPLTIRSATGDCVDLILTSEFVDAPENAFHSKVNIHSHFVQFDPQASDGVITGFSYEQSVRPYRTEDRFLLGGAFAGDQEIRVTHTERLRPGIWVGVGLGEGMCPSAAGGDTFCTEIRKLESVSGNLLRFDRALELDHGAGEAVGVEFVRYAWYSDVDTGTVFFHDHVDFSTWDHGLFGAHIVEPEGATFHDPESGAEVRSGTIVDIHVPSTSRVGHASLGSFREFMVFLHNQAQFDIVPQPIVGALDSGASINLRSEPLSLRNSSEPAFKFSSVTFGDPHTPLPRAYVGDPFMIRGLGVVERVGGIRVTGHRFGTERFADQAARTDAMFLGISERFDFLLEGGAGGGELWPEDGEPQGYPGDYLYYSTVGRDFLSGAWGILRVHDSAQSDLMPLPGRSLLSGGSGFPQQSHTGGAPRRALGPGAPCPDGAPLRSYDIAIQRANILYNADSRDSGGIVYTLGAGADGGGRPDVDEPLVLRVNDGECLELNLTNRLSARAGINIGELRFDPQGSSGTSVGFNLDSTVLPGGSARYRYFADRELGTTLALNLAQPETGASGAFAAVVVEPAGSVYVDPVSGRPIETGIRAEIVAPGGRFHEFVALFQDDDERIGQNTMPYPTQVRGFTGISYSAQPLADRAGFGPENVFNSFLFGDPRLMVTAQAGDPVTFRVAQPWGEQLHVFALEGHRFRLEPDMTGSEQVFSRLLAPGMSFDAPLVGGAGGGFGFEGDYLFLDHRQPFLEAGLWGLLRVTPAPLNVSVRIRKALWRSDRQALRVTGFLTALEPLVPGQAQTVDLYAPGSVNPGGVGCAGTLVRTLPTRLRRDDRLYFRYRSANGAFPTLPDSVCVEAQNGSVLDKSVRQR